jgi:RNA polymerase sigma-70 factor (ECF subfamily)
MPDELDSELLRRFANGDVDAFEALFRRFQHEVYRWAVRIVRDSGTAEDVVVEAFWRAYRARARFDPTRGFGGWMRRIATNVARDHLKAARNLARGRSSDAVEHAEAQADSDPDVSEAVNGALRRLSPKLQVVAVLALVEGLPHVEIADALDVPIGTVKSRLYRAIRALRKELASMGIEP